MSRRRCIVTYRKVGRYDYEQGRPVWSTGRRAPGNTVERERRARSGGVLGLDKCGGELVVLETDKGLLVCGCTGCGQIQYWELSS